MQCRNVLRFLEPEEPKNYKLRYSSEFKRWHNLKRNRMIFNAVRETLVADQKGFCAYYEVSIHENKGSVEHFIPRKQSIKEKNYDLDWQNILAICILYLYSRRWFGR